MKHFYFLIVALLMSSLCHSQSQLAGFTRVAYDDCGNTTAQPNKLTADGNWTFTNPGGIAAADLSVNYANVKVQYKYKALNVNAQYKMVLSFMSDGKRVQTTDIDGDVILSNKTLPVNSVERDTIMVPSDAFADGTITLTTSLISGPNAVISQIELWENANPRINSNFTYSSVASGGNTNYTFVDASSAYNTTITSWAWSFPGGTPASFTGKTPPTIQYPEKGIYKASLTTGDGTITSTRTVDIPQLYTVAYDDAGNYTNEPHLVSSNGDWTFKGLTVTNDTINSVSFGDSVVFVYTGLKATADYKVKLRFTSDANRQLSVKANNTVLFPSISLTSGNVYKCEAIVPSTNPLRLVFNKISGQNAVISDVQILSNDTSLLGALPVMVNAPRLSPRPSMVAGCSSTKFDLNGSWKFNVSPTAGFQNTYPGNWSDISVPGEWSMQGYTVAANVAAGYVRKFTLPDDWKNKRIKLRCEAVYSDATIWVNGQKAGTHVGGFTQFELDVTDFVVFGAENIIALAVKNESSSNTLSSGSQYACHPLGGISRNISLIALPNQNISSLFVNTTFDNTYTNANLNIAIEAANENSGDKSGLKALLSLVSPSGTNVPLSITQIKLDTLKGSASIPVAMPVKWDYEHPKLYTLTIALDSCGKTLQTISQKVGFREVKVVGNLLLVNGVAIKIKGINHHEVYPTTGRSVPAGIDTQDVSIFREANVNHLRTCHYPPDESLLNAADSLGMFVECEAPFCWAGGSGNTAIVVSQTNEMVVAYRNHPSIIFWSIANESSWGYDFYNSSKVAKILDPTRPQTFNYMDGNVNTIEEGSCEIANVHYPNHWGVQQARNYKKRPVYLGENTHLNAYNRLELATDQSLRDIWGKYLREMTDDIDTTAGSLGESVWAGIDDTFFMPNGDVVGYGTWGPIDGWRRLKPEWWGVKKAYSPIRITNTDTILIKDNKIDVKIQNRYMFSNLNETLITWKLGDQSGTINANIPAKTKGVLSIPLLHLPVAGDKLELNFSDPRGFMADQFSLTVKGYEKPLIVDNSTDKSTYTETADTITVTSGTKSWKISKVNGQLVKFNNVEFTGPQLMLLALNNTGSTQMTGPEVIWTPFTDPCTNWSCTSVNTQKVADTVTVTIVGKYAEASGSYKLIFKKGHLEVDYNFSVIKAINPRQVGVVFSLPSNYENLTWERKGYWDVYPSDHIGRLSGTVSASAGFAATSVGPRTKPGHPWRLDNLPYGNNDFCSTKHNIYTATLTNNGGSGVLINSNGTQHVRAWKNNNKINFLVADYSNAGNERFLRGLASADDKPLSVGSSVKGLVKLYQKSGTPEEQTNTERVNDFSTLNVYPNPSNGIFVIQSNKPQNSVCQILDLKGHILKEINIMAQSHMTIDLSNYSSGIYMLKEKDTNWTCKIMIQ